ncbi:PIG-L family deacetylase [Phycicoccus endophyticus]|uniref:PIG-L family deacetylase n=1 Tax=Phycicoccus endophyticus TaxID=1690220 RepID=A0A7G9QYX6_9MICO|nr:PIG-L deacetylase family protein [Phycicoccus endophyticus]NHI18888.1 PIG-L family deacetylase [Phycicoccus endophyticus]QNN48551.1 PIG-L family deacetylase [Phycicoccus endophyticus]GGL31158.1 GlcNAc-PI de-N-acetylase [Phycicoccus endophyticus]
MTAERPTLPPLEGPFRSVLCVVAHPDDIEYGTAAAVHRWVAGGATVSYLLLTRGEAGIDTMEPARAAGVREAEELESARRVGVESVEFAGWPDGALEYGVPLRREIAAAIRRHRPQLVVGQTWELFFGPGAANQADHRAVGLATLDAVADAGNRWLHRDLLDAGLEPWGGVEVLAVAGSPHPTHAVDVTGDPFEAAVHSLEAHAAYNAALPPDFPAPRELLTTILGGGGEQAGVERAWTAQVVLDRR